MSLILSGFSANAQISFHTVWRDVEAWGLICESEGWGWLSLGVWMGNWIFLGFGYSPDFSRNMLFFHPDILSRRSLETLAIYQEFLSAEQSLPGGQHCALWGFTAGVWVCGLFFCCTCARAAACEPQLNLCWESVSWSHASQGWTPFPTASSNVRMAANACMGNTHAPCTKRNCPFPFLDRIKWQRHSQLQKESIQEGIRGLLLLPQFSAAKSKLPLQKNRLPRT